MGEMSTTKWLIVVRSGATEQFERLKAQFANDPNTTVQFDRRVGPRRKRQESRPNERRGTDRRQAEDPRLLIDGWFKVEAPER